MTKGAEIISIANSDNVEAAIPHLHESLDGEHSIVGITVTLVHDNGEQEIEAFGDVRARDVAYTAAILTGWAGNK